MRHLYVQLVFFLFLSACATPHNIRWLEEYPYDHNGTEFLQEVAVRTVRVEAVSVANGNSVLVSRGAGAVVSSNGLVLTANHVLGERFTVLYAYRCGLNTQQSAISCGKQESARVVWRDPSHDLALLRIVDAHNMPRFRLGRLAGLKRGDLLWRVGMDDTGWAAGPLLAARSSRVSNRMEILVPARGGASGGPVVDSEGRLVGIVTSTPSEEVAISLVTYAVSIDFARGRLPSRR